MHKRDGLPLLSPSDPQNLLSIEARKRIERAHIKAEKFIWEAEALIKTRHLDHDSPQASSLRNKACFKKAKAVLSVHRREYSRVGLPEQEYRKIMNDEIEAASNSLQLNVFQQRQLETEFFFPEERPTQSRPVPAKQIPVKAETVATQLKRLQKECRLTAQELADLIDVEVRSVQRHLAGDSVPYDRYIRAYEREFSKLLNRKVLISKLS